MANRATGKIEFPIAAFWLCGLCTTALAPAPTHAESIRFLAPVANTQGSVPWEISADGTTVVGESDAAFGPLPIKHAARWVIPAAPGSVVTGEEIGAPLSGAWAEAVNFDGSAIAGRLDSNAFRWTANDGITEISPFGPAYPAIATGISADGNTVFGWANASPEAAFRWTLAGGSEPLAMSRVTGCTSNGRNASGWIGEIIDFRQAVQWIDGSATIVGGTGSFATAISSGSSPVVMCGYPAHTAQMAIWIDGAQALLPPEMTVLAVSGDGRTIGGMISAPGNILSHAVIWTADRGIVDLNTYLPSIGINLDSQFGRWELAVVTAISFDGQVIAGYGSLGGSSFKGFVVDRSFDTDRDGLSDDWEINGIPYFDSEGEGHRYVLPGANPLRKDVYVEVDAMSGMAPPQSALDRVAAAFNAAPVPPVPDHLGALPGVTLQATLDDSDIPPRFYLNNDGWEEFQADKSQFFGTSAERASPDRTEKLKAKAKAYRYCIFAQWIPNSVAGRVLGIAEVDINRPANGPRMGGNDFMMGFQGYTPIAGFTLEAVQASTFMHELGHTLGLYHGGGYARLNHNPNHFSVMNYTWAGCRSYLPGDQILLDYDRYALPPLSEYYLSESAGIGGTFDLLGVVAPIVVRNPGTAGPCSFAPVPPAMPGTCHAGYGSATDRCIRYVSMVGAVDWNNDGIISPDPHRVCADPNGDLNVDDLVSGPLTSVNEWNLLAYDFRESPFASDSVIMDEVARCPTFDEDLFLASLPPPPPPVECPDLPVAGAPSPTMASYCLSGASPEFRITPQGADPFTVQWSMLDETQDPPAWTELVEGGLGNGAAIDGAQNGTLRIYGAQNLGAAALQLRCRVTDACGQTSDSSECTLLIGALVASPASPTDVIACPGASASFSISTAGPAGPFEYQWLTANTFLYDGELANGTLVSGMQTPTLTISNINPADFGRLELLRCVVTDGCQAVESENFSFAPRGVNISTQPQYLSLPCTGTPQAELSVVAAGPALTYAWRKDGQFLTNGGRISGATSPTLIINTPTGVDAGDYECVVTSACGSDTSTSAYLNVGPPIVLLDPPVAPPTCIGGYAFLYTVATGSDPLSYQWSHNGQDLQDSDRIFGARESSISLIDVLPSDLGSYTVRVTNDCGEATSQQVELTALPTVVITGQPTDTQTCPNSAVLLNVTTAVESPTWTYRWEHEDPGAPGHWLQLFNSQLTQGNSGVCANITGISTPTLRLDWLDNFSPGCTFPHRFRCRIHGDCETIISDAATVTLVPGAPPVIQAAPQSGYVCAGQTAVLSVTATGAAPLSYQWYRGGQPLAGETQSTLTLPHVTSAAGGVYTVQVASTCGAITSPPATLIVTIRGDANCDGLLNNFDIDPFVAAIVEGPSAWESVHGCDFTCANDVDRSGAVNNFDIDPFVQCIVNGGCP